MARVYWDFRDQLLTDEGLLTDGPSHFNSIGIETCLRKSHAKWELNITMRRPVTALLISGPQHPPEVNFF